MTLEEIVEEFLDRQRHGDSPTVDEYALRFPALESEVRATLPAIALVEHHKQDSGLRPTQDLEAEPSVPERIGNYQIVGEIGRGGMGIVYEAEQCSLGRRVALKVVRPHVAIDTQTLARFQREARAAGKMHHTNIVTVFEVGEDQGAVFYSMQLIKGASLDHVIAAVQNLLVGDDANIDAVNSQRLDSPEGSTADEQLAAALLYGQFAPRSLLDSSTARTRSSPIVTDGSDSGDSKSQDPTIEFDNNGKQDDSHYMKAAAQLGLQVAEALEYAHARSVVHRDIKPSNLILDAAGVMWVTDFGLAKVEDDNLTQTGDFIGTLRYMSPERLHGQCDHRCDIYGLGLTLYELLTLRPGIDASNKLETIERLKHAEIPRPRLIRRCIPIDLETIILKAIEKEPADRYQSAQAMADDLRRFIADEPISARQISVFERGVRWSRRNRSLAALLLTVACSILLIAIVTPLALLRESTLRSQAERAWNVADQRAEQINRNLYLAEMNLAGQSTRDTYGAPTIRQRLQKWRPDQAGVDLRGWEWFYLHALTHRARFTSPHLGDFVWSVDFAPSAKKFCNVVENLGIQVRDSETGEIIREKKEDSLRFAEYSPNGQHIAVSTFQDGVNIYDATTLEVVNAIGGSNSFEVFCVDWSPDGKRLATCKKSGEGPHGFRIWDAFTGKLVKQIDKAPSLVYIVQWSPDGKKLLSCGNHESQIWDTETWQPLYALKGSKGGCWSTDSQQVAIADVICDAETGEQISQLSGTIAHSARWNPHAAEIAASQHDGTIAIFDAVSGKQTRTLLGHTKEIWCVAWSPNGTRLASGCLDGVVRTWDIDVGDQNQFLPENKANQSQWSHDGRYLALGSTWASNVSIWDSNSGHTQVIDTEATRVMTLSWTANDRFLAWSGENGTRILDRETGEIRQPNANWMRDSDWNAAGNLLAGAEQYAKRLWIYDYTQDEMIVDQEVPASSVQWHPRKPWLAVGQADGRLKLTDALGKSVWEGKYSDETVRDISFSGTGDMLATAENGALIIWDADTGERLKILDDLSEHFYSVDWSSDDKQLVSCGYSSVAIWDIHSGKVAIKLSGSAGNADWNPDGKRIAAGFFHEGYRIWDATCAYRDEMQTSDTKPAAFVSP